MQFTLGHQRQTIGQQIQVKAVAGAAQQITRVSTQFDGFTLADDACANGTTQYERTFDGQSAGSGSSHTLLVTAFNQDSQPESAVKMWTDPS